MTVAEFQALVDEAIRIKNEQTLWAEIARRENSFLGRLKRWFYRMRLA